MKKIVLVAILFPVLLTAQVKKSSKPNPATTTAKKEVVQPATGFVINGEVTGFADGTQISLLNGQTGAPEQQVNIDKNKFTFKGKVNNPAFKIIIVNNQPPYLTLFLDNSDVKVSGYKEALDRAIVTGSPSHNDFMKLNNSLAPYQSLFAENASKEATAVAAAKQTIENFIQQNPTSPVGALAVIRYMQLSPEDLAKTEQLFNSLTPAAKATDLGAYVQQQIAESKINAVGSVLDDFTQTDTTGKPISLSSFRGKYVLIDFWASWCRPCRQENPNVVANYNKFKDKNFTVLGVSLDKAKPAWIEAISMDGLTWPHVSDLQGWSNAVAQQFKIQSIPQNFLIGPDGKIIAKNLRGPDLERKLEQLLR